MNAFRRFLTRGIYSTQNDLENQRGIIGNDRLTIEDFPAGYPRFAALIGSDSCLQVYRGFSALRSRNILLKQDKLSILEQKLNDLDREEEFPPLLSSCRRDSNSERQALLSDIDKALIEYDETMTRNAQIFNLGQARSRPITALRNWIQGNGCIARDETEYLQHENDLIALSSRQDDTMTFLIEWVEDKLIMLPGNMYKNRCRKYSRDAMVYIPDGNFTANLARILLGSFVIFLIIAPVIICISLQSILSRLIVISLSTTFFIASLSGGTQAKIVEIFAAGAAYATVLTVFITQDGA